ncbi:MAG TPA: RagB/SusD family nutrient uptake outer membrane protein [Bacteroidales bacterium]|nr:RagB/SusD family nutrient uptake outer membrane protein [Bacteroidales bacterium]
MKKIFNLIIVLVAATLVTSCTEFLEEEPRSLLTAQYLETASGVESALNSAYSDLRLFYGGESAMTMTVAGTDEFQRGPDGNLAVMTYDQAALLTNGMVGTTWNWGYTAINTANAVIQFAPASGMMESRQRVVMAEARFIRALWYFNMVRMYGDLVLNLRFNQVPSTKAYRTSVDSVYMAIINDLEIAKNDLPKRPAEPGRVWGASARHLLSLVYLTRATHPTAGRPTDYQNAFDNAMYLINNAGTYGVALLRDFADVHRPRNENNAEVLFNVQRSTDQVFNEAAETAANFRANRSSFFYRPNYGALVRGLVRDIPYGRPWHRVRPTNYLLEVAFAERNDDTRYNKTFQTLWRVNDAANAEMPGFANGDTAIWLPGVESHRPARALRIFRPSEYFDNVTAAGTRQTLSIFPSMRKYDDIDRPSMNDASVRPFIVFRFAETYLIAAEAAMYLNRPAEARNLLNVVRTRAAFLAGRADAANAAAVARITAATPSMTDHEVGINFILDERSRELAGEYMRWFDLVRTRNAAGVPMLLHRLRNATPALPGSGIQDHHILRPIPQSQRDLTTNPFPQNPGFGT